MPYRRLPNTDQARLRALKNALAIAMKTPLSELAFSQINLSRMQAFTPSFEQVVAQHRRARKNQGEKSKNYGELLKKARLYVSHFIQVMNFCVIRGELKPHVREFYGLNKHDKSVPVFKHDSDVIDWGKKVVEGEQERTRMGEGSAIYSPSIAVVKVHYEEFVDAYRHQKMLQSITARASEKVAELREEADTLILNVWNEVETKFVDLPDEEKRKEAAKYGVIYFYRPKERKKIAAQKLQTNIPFGTENN